MLVYTLMATHSWHTKRWIKVLAHDEDEAAAIARSYGRCNDQSCRDYLYQVWGPPTQCHWVKVSRPHIRKVLRETGRWEGLISQCNVSPSHLVDGWHLGCPVNIEGFKGSPNEQIDAHLLDIKTNFEWYNHDAELGRYASFWEPQV